MINIFINIDSHQWEWWMKCTEHYTSKMWEKHNTLRRGDSMNLNTIEKHCEQQPQVKQEWCMSKLYKPQPWWAETHKCYNCEKLKHLARTCKKPHILFWVSCQLLSCWHLLSLRSNSELFRCYCCSLLLPEFCEYWFLWSQLFLG